MNEQLTRSGSPSCDVAIIGAGPAGLAATEVMRPYGLSVTVIDEQPRPGGQILRQPPRTFTVDNWLPAKLYGPAKSVLRSMGDATEVSWRLGSTVLGIMPPSPYSVSTSSGVGHSLWIQGPGGWEVLHARAVLIATGCYERPLPFPGWTLPGVMGAGGIQGFVKSQQFVPGNRFVFAGSHPLQLVVADQLVQAGADVAAVIFTQQRHHALDLLRYPLVILEHTRKLAEAGRILLRLRRAGVPVKFGSAIVQVSGKNAVERVTIAPLVSGGRVDLAGIETIDCDRVGVCHGFLVCSELARQAGARVSLKLNEGGWLVEHDSWFESSVSNVFVAGEVTAMAGADAALEKGRVAGIGILRALQQMDSNEARRLARSPRRRLRGINRFAKALNRLAQPGNIAAVTTEDTIICRCESITLGELRSQLQENPHIVSADAAKLATRAGMGMCQGRFCSENVARVVAEQRGMMLADVGTFHVQAPIKPTMIGRLQQAVVEE